MNKNVARGGKRCQELLKVEKKDKTTKMQQKLQIIEIQISVFCSSDFFISKGSIPEIANYGFLHLWREGPKAPLRPVKDKNKIGKNDDNDDADEDKDDEEDNADAADDDDAYNDNDKVYDDDDADDADDADDEKDEDDDDDVVG